MARITKQKCRKQVMCSKCGQPIQVGEEYLKGTPFRRSPICRHVDCGLKQWELSSSSYIQTCGSLVDDWESNYSVGPDAPSSIIDELETLKDECECSLDNMPEPLQESETGELLQTRIESIENAISALEDIDFDSLVDDYVSEHEDDEDFNEDDVRDNPPSDVLDELIFQIDDALSELEW